MIIRTTFHDNDFWRLQKAYLEEVNAQLIAESRKPWKPQPRTPVEKFGWEKYLDYLVYGFDSRDENFEKEIVEYLTETFKHFLELTVAKMLVTENKDLCWWENEEDLKHTRKYLIKNFKVELTTTFEDKNENSEFGYLIVRPGVILWR
jgi:hypothetical protein